MRRIRSSLFLMVLVLAIAFQPLAAYAAAPAPAEQGGALLDLHCADQACSFAMDLGRVALPAYAGPAATILFETLKDNVSFLPEDAALAVTDDLLLKLPVGELALLDADVTMELSPDNRVERLRGTAQVPFPTFGIFDQVQVVTPARADVGLDTGANLSHLGAPLDPERTYLFFDIGAGLEVAASQATADGSVHQFGISVPQGQRATLVVDPLAPFVYLAGNVTLSHSEQIAFVGDLLDTADGWLPEGAGLPLADRTSVYVSGLFTDDAAESYLKIGAAHGIDGGSLGEWAGVEVSPLHAQGLMTIRLDGIQLSGVARSYLQPERYFDGQVAADVYVPFSRNWDDAYVALAGEAAAPIVGLSARGDAQVNGDLQAQASGEVVTPWSQEQTAVAVTPAEEPAPEEGGRWAPLAGVRATVGNATAATVQAAGSGYAAVRDGVARGADWTVDGAASAYNTVEESTVRGWDAAGNLWCGATGWCAAEAASAVAQAGE